MVSVVIPSYRAEKFIGKSLLKIKEVLDSLSIDYEIICVDDGSTDKSLNKARNVASKFPVKIRVVGYKNNLGKGYAVKFGMAKAKGDIVGFMDAGMDINPVGIQMLLSHFEWYDADIIVGSKRHPVSKVHYTKFRALISFVYQMLVKLLFGLKVRDTQVGIKFFRREVLEKVLPRVLVKAFAFDVELLVVANSLGFRRIYEAPVEMKMKFAGGISTIASKGFIRVSFKTFWDTAAVFYRLKLLHYYDDINRKNWITPEYLTLRKK